jgi:hypothetical protein
MFDAFQATLPTRKHAAEHTQRSYGLKDSAMTTALTGNTPKERLGFSQMQEEDSKL